jgi:hypothetical protein
MGCKKVPRKEIAPRRNCVLRKEIAAAVQVESNAGNPVPVINAGRD